MKASLNKKTSYAPFDLTLTIESKEEAACLYALFNHSSITDILENNSDINSDNIRKVIEKGNQGTPNYDPIHSLFRAMID